MCGFAGFLGFGALGTANVLATAQKMGNAIRHRGPDDSGVWHEEDGQMALVHRRLSILDLSPAGHQPMPSPSGRYVLAFNGEIYNHLNLRAELEKIGAAPAWRGYSDTETLLAGFDAWGVKTTVEKAVGMFAFALWDGQKRELTLGRDRLGEKPLYYGWQGVGADAVFLFGSELKALRAHPAFAAPVSRDALCLYMRHNNVPAPYTIYGDIWKLKPGCLLTVSERSMEPEISPYWSVAEVAMQGVQTPFSGSANEAVDALESLLKDAVRQQMVADVPLGAFLSGGVDSSTVVALMQAQATRPVRTFSIGFQEPAYDEAIYAKDVALHLGTDHTELYVTPEQAMDVIPHLAKLYDEPFADSSQIPTFLVSKMAREHVTVSLSGDGGDELFAGYNRYQVTASAWMRIKAVPRPLRQLGARALTCMSPDTWNRMAAATPLTNHWLHLGDKIHKGAAVLASESASDVYRGLVSQWQNPADVVLSGRENATLLTGDMPTLNSLNDVERMMALDLMTYLPDDILTKVDRAAMGVSLETRVPFLDHRVVEFAWSLPLAFKLRQGVTKWPLRQVLYRHVPRALIERPKMGFGVPIDRWLRGPLRDWAESLLSEPRLRAEGFFRPEPIRIKWAEHLSGQRNWQHQLWSVLMFQSWLEHNRGA
jgi:asparagine synthase (glutamine-hydrolysing)